MHCKKNMLFLIETGHVHRPMGMVLTSHQIPPSLISYIRLDLMNFHLSQVDALISKEFDSTYNYIFGYGWTRLFSHMIVIAVLYEWAKFVFCTLFPRY